MSWALGKGGSEFVEGRSPMRYLGRGRSTGIPFQTFKNDDSVVGDNWKCS